MTVNAFDTMSLDQQISALVEGRKPSEKQLEQAVFLIDAGVLSDAANAAAYIEAVRDFNRAKREAAGEVEKRVPKVQQVINALQQYRDESVQTVTFAADTPPTLAWVGGINEAISVAGRYV